MVRFFPDTDTAYVEFSTQTVSETKDIIYRRADISELINIPNVKGQVKPYQLKQFLSIVERYNLHME